PYEPPAIAVLSWAISWRASALSIRANRSVNGAPPSCWLPRVIIAWPYQGEIAGSGSKTAYPAATKGSGFHRYVQAFHEPQGPPRIITTSGNGPAPWGNRNQARTVVPSSAVTLQVSSRAGEMSAGTAVFTPA